MAVAQPRARIVAVASKLLADGGRDAVTTRAVAEAARVQAPTIYRLFGDKRGLLDAVVAHGIAHYLDAKVRRVPVDDPVEEIRAGWDRHVAFGLANPALYALMADPDLELTAGRAGIEVLEASVHRIALAGRLAVPEARAVELVHAAGLGTVLALLQRSDPRPDDELSATAREAVIAAITTPAGPRPPRAKPARRSRRAASSPSHVAAAITLRAGLAALTELTPRERDLLDEWLARISSTPSGR